MSRHGNLTQTKDVVLHETSCRQCTSDLGTCMSVESPTCTDDSRDEKAIPSASNWTGPEDPGNPHNWPLRKRIFHTVVPSSITLISTLVSSAYVPTIYAVEAEMDVPREVSLLAYTIFIFGLAVGGLFMGPCSELFGRKIVYWVSTPVLAIFVMGTGFSHNSISLILTRFFSGVFGSASLVVSGGSLADLWADHERTLPMALFVVCPFFGPALGPIIGTYVMEWRGWRWTAWIEILLCVAVLVPSLFMEETSKRQILVKRASKLNIQGPVSPVTGKTPREVVAYYAGVTLLRPIRMLFKEPVVLLFSLWVSFNFALLYSFFCAFEWVFLVYYQFLPQSISLTFIGLGTGAIVGVLLIFILVLLTQKKARAQHTERIPHRPEHRLILSMIGGPLIPIALFAFGWTAYKSMHWILPVLAEGLFGCGNYLVFMGAISYLVDVYGPIYGASALGANTMLRYLMGTVFPLFAVQIYEHLHVEWASTLLACISVVMMFIPVMLYKAGPWLRSKSSFVKEP